MARDIDRKLTELKHFALRLSLGMHAAQERTYACNELARAEGLDQIVVCAQLKADDLVHFAIARAQEQDRRVIRGANTTAEFIAIDARKHDVENIEIVGFLLDERECLFTVASSIDRVVFLLQSIANEFGDRWLVVNDKNARRSMIHS